MCRVLGVAPSGYYKWVKQPTSNRAQEDARLLRLIRPSFIASQGIYAVVMDLFSRKIVGWAAGPTIRRKIVLNAVLAAVRRRRPHGTLIHSDQGTQYGSDAWRRFWRSNHLQPSMSRKGNCWDNAVAESFFSSLKKERIKKHIYKNRELALSDVADYIETFYNRTRRHSHLGGLSPQQFEAAQKQRPQGVH
jgi:putative transposase